MPARTIKLHNPTPYVRDGWVWVSEQYVLDRRLIAVMHYGIKIGSDDFWSYFDNVEHGAEVIFEEFVEPWIEKESVYNGDGQSITLEFKHDGYWQLVPDTDRDWRYDRG